MENEARLVRECAFRQSGSPVRIHFHNAYELLLVRQGRAEIRVGAQGYEVGAGSLLVIGRFEEHAIERCSADYARSYLILDPVRLEHLLTDRRLLFPLRSRPAGFCHLFDVSEFLPRACALLDALAAEAQSPAAFSEQYCLCRVTELLIYMQRTPAAAAQQAANKPVRSAVAAVQTFIEGHFAEPLSIGDLAARVFMTPCYLTHCFKETTGYSPKQYLVLHRVACAKELLSGGALPVGEVAFRAGFTDVNNFIRTFKRDAGVTPLRYRESQQQTSQL